MSTYTVTTHYPEGTTFTVHGFTQAAARFFRELVLAAGASIVVVEGDL